MRYTAVLNNYQIGSYANNVLENKISNKVRIDSEHTIVCWELEPSEARLLEKVVKNLEKGSFKAIHFNGEWYHIDSGKKLG